MGATYRLDAFDRTSAEGVSQEGATGRGNAMCLTCGCLQAHLEMGEHQLRYEDVKAAADENGRSVAETIGIIDRTWAADREAHAEEYSGA
jgi:hypothetical protein